MKTIENKETALKLNEEENVKYSHLLITVLNQPPKEGATIQDMRRDFRLIDLLEGAKETFELNEADIKYVATAISKCVWGIRHKDLIEFEDYINSLK